MPDLTRRKFLKASAVAGAAVTLGEIAIGPRARPISAGGDTVPPPG
jgi:anaerobic selenocysteine-containing dehydrogenase